MNSVRSEPETEELDSRENNAVFEQWKHPFYKFSILSLPFAQAFRCE